MNSEARIDLAPEDFVLATARNPAEAKKGSASSNAAAVWRFCNNRLAPHWSAACISLASYQTESAPSSISSSSNGCMNPGEVARFLKNAQTRSTAASSQEEQLIQGLSEAVGSEKLMRSPLLKDRALKCLQSVKALADTTVLDDPLNLSRNVVEDRHEHLFCVGLRYLLPSAVSTEDFGADGVYGCAAAMREIAWSYQGVAYHNGSHAALVTHHTVEIATFSGLWACMDDHERMAIVLSAVGHDINHPGVGASLFLKSNHPLALIYNDKHVLENYHAASLIQVLSKHNYAPAAKRPSASRTLAAQADIKSLIIQCVLWTDLTDHARIMTAISNTLNVIKKTKHKGRALMEWLQKSKSSLRDLAGLVLKISDLSYFALTDPALMIEWTVWLYAEIYGQRQIELENNLPLCEAQGVQGLGTRLWFEANLSFCSQVLMPMALSLASFESRLKPNSADPPATDADAAATLTLPTTAVKVLAEELSVDWQATAKALKARDTSLPSPLPPPSSPVDPSAANNTVAATPTAMKTAARWLAHQSNTVKRKGTAAIHSLLEPTASDTTMNSLAAKNGTVLNALVTPIQNNIEILKKARYAN